MKENPKYPAKLIFEDGTFFTGYSFGYPKDVTGEVVFNTGMVGYPETMTDPSYNGQILVLTYPLIGNYGVPGDEKENGMPKNFESDKIQIRALIVSDLSVDYSHWNAKKSLNQWMIDEHIPGIYGIDTRMLTRKLREKGTVPGKIVFDSGNGFGEHQIAFEDPNQTDLVSEVTTKEPVLFTKGDKKIIVVDCGVKNNIVQAFLRRDISVLRVPYDYNFLSEPANGVVLSNGPGDPQMCKATIEHTRNAIQKGIPMLGICLGSQILGLAAGANTYKLKYGHRSHNQPVNETGTRRCYITSQNHGYAIDGQTLPEDWREWFVNDNDGTNEGIIHISKPLFGAQFHPEASPGPDDCEFIFDMFVRTL
ncbi:MAG: glutamine-hydrolyzing carbamoyl-phosphate synthase small subunit [bacterium]